VKKSRKISGWSAIGLKSSFVFLIFLSYLLISPYNFFKKHILVSKFIFFIVFFRREGVVGFQLRKLVLGKI